MSLTRIVCPHCEQSVEVSMTSVTRSCDCPNCGKVIILQTAARDGKPSRRALLTPAPVVDDGDGEATAFTPQPLSGDPRQRMVYDPEVQRTATLFKWGTSIFGAMLCILLLWHYLQLGTVISDSGSLAPSSGKAAPAADSNNGSNKKSDAGLTVSKTATKEKQKSETKTKSEPEALSGPRLTDQQQALNAAVSFLDAATVEERLTKIRDRKLNETRVRNYYTTRQTDGPVLHERIEPLEVNPVGSLTYSFNVVLPDGTRRKIVMEKAQSGDYLADWASFVVYSEASWDALRAKRPAAPTMLRLLADGEEVFGRDFNDPAALVCLRLLDPLDQNAKPIYGYASKSSSLGRTLKFVLEKGGGQPVPLMVKVNYPENSATDDQVWIAEFIGEGWMSRNW